MTTIIRNICVAMMISGVLSACSTSAISTHANAVDHAGTSTSHIEERGSRNLRKQNTDHVSLKGDNSKGFLSAGKEHFQNQNYGLAEKNFRKAAEVRSDNPAGWFGLAASLDQIGRFEFSDRAYKQLAQLKQKNARVLNNMGYSHLLRGDYQKARSILNRAQQIDPNLEEIQDNIHLLEKIVRS